MEKNQKALDQFLKVWESRMSKVETLETKTDALEEREEALTAADESQRLEEAAATAKAARKS